VRTLSSAKGGGGYPDTVEEKKDLIGGRERQKDGSREKWHRGKGAERRKMKTMVVSKGEKVNGNYAIGENLGKNQAN